MRGLGRLGLTVALAAAATGYFTAEDRVVLFDGARERVVTTFAPTVGSALARMGVRVGPDDRVLPSPASPLPARIEVRRARGVTLHVNGERRGATVTGITVGEVLQELSVDANGAYLYPAPTARVGAGEEIVVVQPAAVTVVHDGKTDSIQTNALTAGALLRQMGIALGPHDRVEPSIVARPAAGSTIRVVRVKDATDRTYAKIPFKRVTQKTGQLEYGIHRTGQPGADGLRARTYRVTYEDGRVKRRVLLGSEVVRPPRDEVTLVGTRRPTYLAHGHSESGAASWYRLPGLGAAHRSLPMGTVVRVTNLANGRRVDVVVRDRGPYLDGRIIDLSDTAFQELAPLGAGVANVKIEW